MLTLSVRLAPVIHLSIFLYHGTGKATYVTVAQHSIHSHVGTIYSLMVGFVLI